MNVDICMFMSLTNQYTIYKIQYLIFLKGVIM